MKKTAKIIAAMMSAAMMTGTVPFTSGAVYKPFREDSLAGYTMLEKGKYSFTEPYYTENGTWNMPGYLEGTELYVRNDRAQLLKKKPGIFWISFLLDTKFTQEDVTEILDKYISGDDYLLDYEGIDLEMPGQWGNYSVYIADTSLSVADIKSICKELRATGGIMEMNGASLGATAEDWYRSGIISNDFLAFYRNEEEIVSDYLTEKGIAFTTEEINDDTPGTTPGYYSTAVKFVPETEMDQLEKIALFDEIFTECGLSERDPSAYTVWESPVIIGTHRIDLNVYDYVDGDANNDGKLTVSDAVAVLQYIANKDKYPLTAQAKFNADIDGEEGITGRDAIAIQMIDAGIV
ncbi:MAG: dockerin type I repeat-containing protein [Ruminococcus sp.]|nr:dockerin type I repeat-containing protein [Ruminococcus sp.]